jgi:hypothetical protein
MSKWMSCHPAIERAARVPDLSTVRIAPDGGYLHNERMLSTELGCLSTTRTENGSE